MRSKSLVDQFQSNGRGSFQTLTVDVFDTVLLRTTWPEELQFGISASRWLDDVRRVVDPSITESELVSFRKYSREVYWLARREELRRNEDADADHEIHVSAWFSLMIEMLMSKYGSSAKSGDIESLVHRMVAHEIDVEFEHTRPNHRLLKTLEHLKKQYGLRIYFCSDIYLSSDHIKSLMERHRITVFDEGVTSADRRCGKWSGKLFRNIERELGWIDLATNVHVGDDPTSDFLAPIREGSHAVLYKSLHHVRRAVSRAIGRRKLQRMERARRRSIAVEFKKSFADDAVGIRIGSLFAPAATEFVHRVSRAARLNRNICYVAVSSEAIMIERLMSLLDCDKPKNFHSAPRLNRKSFLRELASTVVLSSDAPRMSALSHLMVHAEGPIDDFDVLRLFDDEFGELVASKVSHEMRTEFILDRLVERIEFTREARSRESAMVREMMANEHVTIVDVGWLGTIQVLAREIAAFADAPPNIEGLYLGARSINPFGVDRGRMEGLIFPSVEDVRNRPFFLPEIWEFVLSSSMDDGASAKSRAVAQGLQSGAEYWKTSVHCSPAEFFRAMRPELSRLLVDPEMEEMLFLGTIEWTTGFTKEWTKQIVDFSHNRKRKFIKGWIQPRKSVRDVTNLGPQSWSAAYVKFYRLGHLRPILRYLGDKRGVFYA